MESKKRRLGLLALTEYAGQTPETIKELVRDLHKNLGQAEQGDAQLMQQRADELFPEEYLRQFHQAALYEGQGLLYEHLAKTQNRRRFFRSAGRAYHFAGHAYRALEDYRKAGETYEKSGECYARAAFKKLPFHEKDRGPKAARRRTLLPAAIRSFSRAKGVWDDVGDYDQAGDAFLAEQQLRVKQAFRDSMVSGIGRRFWGAITGHGENLGSWLTVLLTIMVAFGVIRWRTGAHSGLFEGLQSSLQATLLLPSEVSHSAAAWVDIAQAAFSYFMLGLGVAIIVRKFSPR